LKSSRSILRGSARNDLQLCADAAEAIPSTYGDVGKGIRDFAAGLEVSAKMVERRRGVGLKWGSVMDEFPPQGGNLTKIDYSVWRDLPAKFSGDAASALAFLKGIVEQQPLPTCGRWTRGAVFECLQLTGAGTGTTARARAPRC
jgi:hypothetical protein